MSAVAVLPSPSSTAMKVQVHPKRPVGAQIPHQNNCFVHPQSPNVRRWDLFIVLLLLWTARARPRPTCASSSAALPSPLAALLLASRRKTRDDEKLLRSLRPTREPLTDRPLGSIESTVASWDAASNN